MSLSENEMSHIEEEEIYRQEVRAKLEKDKPSRTKKEKAWEYANSPVALWILTTVVVGLITLAYTNHLDSVKKKEERNERAQKLQAEINNRQKETLKLLAYLKDKTKEEKYYDEPRWVYKEAVIFMDGKNDPDFLAFQPALYKEFKEENLTALLTELEKVSEKSSDISSLRTRYEALGRLYSESPPSPIKGKPTNEDRQRNVEAIDKTIAIINSN